VEAQQAEVQQREEIQRTYRYHLETLSLTLHPFGIADSLPQTSAQVEDRLHTAVEAIEALACRHQLPARPDAMKKVRAQLPALAALVDFWWQGVQQDLEPFGLSPRWRQWVHAYLLPMVYWDYQVVCTRCRRRKAKMRQTLDAVRTAFERHPVTLRLAPQVLAEWTAWATDRVKSFQRTSSAVEGRNGYLAQMQHNQRGLPKQRYKVWTILHNFDGRAADGTTPAARFWLLRCAISPKFHADSRGIPHEIADKPVGSSMALCCQGLIGGARQVAHPVVRGAQACTVPVPEPIPWNSASTTS
jgi:hypothetical protein